ncbi:hypothetical protein P7K49_021468 [Saguinus oedipus]|uniref:Uncharacterized protein n=1 Tax=Saguinus oedipus TaxID=9490 RepID=A0ABQ9UTI7_SAGOE|nr:hypothetical protein P7K49_021468 [Saguinus oedipus]
MDQNLRPEKAQNEADANNTDVFFHSHSSPPYHRPGHGGSHHHQKSHHGVPHHRDESRHPPEFQDFHGRAASSHVPQSHRHNEAWNHGKAHGPTGFGLAPPQGAAPSQHPYAEDYFDGRRLSDVSQYSGSQQQSDSHYHRGSHHHRRQHYLGENLSHYSSGMSHQRSEASHRDGSYLPHGPLAYNESFHQNEAFYISGIQPDGTHHRQAHQHGWPHHRQVRPHGRPPHHGEALSHPSFVGIPDYHGEYRQDDRHPGEHHRDEHPSHSQHHHHQTHQYQDHHHHRDHHHGAHHSSYLRSDYQYRDYVQSLSQLSIPQQPPNLIHDALSRGASHAGAFPSHMAHPRGSAHSMIPSITAVHSHANQMSRKLHPQIISTKDSENRGKEEGQSWKRKSESLLGPSCQLPLPGTGSRPDLGPTLTFRRSGSPQDPQKSTPNPQQAGSCHRRHRTSTEAAWPAEGQQAGGIGQHQRTHKKGQSTNLLQWLCEKLSHLIQDFREMIRSLTQSLAFETFVFFIVCLNTIMLVAQTFAEVEIRGGERLRKTPLRSAGRSETGGPAGREAVLFAPQPRGDASAPNERLRAGGRSPGTELREKGRERRRPWRERMEGWGRLGPLTPWSRWYFMALDSVFFCIYVSEALLKIFALGLSYFYDFWNNLGGWGRGQAAGV